MKHPTVQMILRFNNVFAVTSTEQQRRSQYADLAENYPADNQYEVGTVLIFGGDAEVTPTTLRGDTRVAGVERKSSTLDEQCIARRQ